ncbi:MAG TPA: hypothetical protein VHV32_19225 [Candidatus Angelobacter sp.]|jgi:hypothetical protein|nr:hypothetical protein [Candidatus Angelobacter sp.]
MRVQISQLGGSFVVKDKNGDVAAIRPDKETAEACAFQLWKIETLHPLAEKLSQHNGQPYSGDMKRSLHQAAIRLGVGDDYDRKMADVVLIELESENQEERRA